MGAAGGGSGGGSEADELRKLDLTLHELQHEGELTLRTDSKRTTVLVSIK